MKLNLSSLMLIATFSCLAAAPARGAEEHVVRTGTGQSTVYVVAENELHNLTRDRAEAVTGGAPRLRAQAVGDTEVRELVLYPKDAPRTEWTRRVLTREVLVRLAPGTDAAALARAVGAVAGPEIPYAPRHYIFRVAQPGAALQVAAQLASQRGVEHVEPVLKRQLAKRLVPNDPLFGQQWTLRNTGQNGATAGADINVTNVWDSYRGTGILVGVIDDGLLYTHPDLAANANTAIHYDYRDGDNDPKPEGTAGVNAQGNPNADSHGTATAGVIAARGNNGIGAAGAAFEATLVGLRLIGGTAGDTQEGGALSHSNAVIHIYNNSWGPSDDGFVKGGAGTLALAALQNGVNTGRGGRGNIFVWAAGNGGVALDNAGYDSYNGSIYTISVAALNDLGQKADYSERGACLVVSAPSGAEQNGRQQGTTTTDLLGDFGYNRSTIAVGAVNPDELADRDYTQNYNGTSSAAPVVSGVVALMLQANPNLGWRDVQEVLIRTATQTDPTNNEWRTNKAGFKFNPNFGAGRVNAGAAVALATNWANLPAMTSTASEQASLNVAVPDNDSNGITRSFDLSASNLRVEQAVVTVDITHANRGDLVINLVSPSGTVSPLAELHGDTNANYTAMTFRSTFNWGEDSKGTWQVQISDRRAANTGTLTRVKLDVFGTTPSAPTLLAKTVGSGQFTLGVAGTPALAYTLQYNTNATVTNWTTLFSTNAPASAFDLIDASASGPRRFYRLVR
jgi:subtilisin-like proprotein convertase family protein